MTSRIWKAEYGVVLVLGVLVSVGAILFPPVRGVVFLLAFIGVSLAVLAAMGVFKGLDEKMRQATALFFVLKLAMAVVSLEATTLVFAGVSDALGYSHVGTLLAFGWKNGLPEAHQSVPGTGGLELIVAHLYSLTVSSQWLGFLTFSWASAIGTILVWHGASRNWPWENRKKLGLALMFLPSLLYWTSPISKEAVVIVGLGVFMVGIGMIFDARSSLGGLLLVLAGGAITFIVRPNITLLMLVSAIAALLLPWSRRAVGRPNPTTRLTIVGLMLLVLIPVVAANRSLLHLAPGQGFVSGGLNSLQNESTIGGNSSFATATPTSIAQVPYAIISVLFRPFPWEARSLLQVVASLEGLILAFWSARVIVRWRRRIIRPRVDGMMLMSIVYILIFCFLFSSLGNFGLLVRERTQAIPFLLIILCSFEFRPQPTSDLAASPVREEITARTGGSAGRLDA